MIKSQYLISPRRGATRRRREEREEESKGDRKRRRGSKGRIAHRGKKRKPGTETVTGGELPHSKAVDSAGVTPATEMRTQWKKQRTKDPGK